MKSYGDILITAISVPYIYLLCTIPMLSTQQIEIPAINHEAMAIREQFFSDLGKEKMDLVIVMERTRAIDNDYFYFVMRKLVNHTLRYSTEISPDAVRLAILTFGQGTTVHIDGLSRSFYKCQLWEGPMTDKYWDKILLNDTEDAWDYGNLPDAYTKALEVFKGSTSQNTTKRYLWLLTSGDFYLSFGDPKASKDKLLDYGVTIVGTLTGHWSNRGLLNTRSVLSSDDHLMGNPNSIIDFLGWTNHSAQPITEREPKLVSYRTDKEDCYCDVITGYQNCDLSVCTDRSACQAGNTCVYRQQSSSTEYYIYCGSKPLLQCDGTYCLECLEKRQVNGPCRCSWRGGFTGPVCTIKETECIPGACSNGGVCVEVNGAYECRCTGLYSGRFCRTKIVPTSSTTKTTSTTLSTIEIATNPENWWTMWRIILIATGAAFVFIMFCVLLIYCCCCCCCCRRQSPETDPEDHRPNRTDVKSNTNGLVYAPSSSSNGSDAPILPPPRSTSLARGLMRHPSIKAVARILPTRRPPPPPKPRHQFSKLYSAQNELTYTNNAPKDEDEDMDDYVNDMVVEGMSEWKPTVKETLTSQDGLDDITIMHMKRTRYISSALRFMPTQNEMDSILTFIKTRSLDMTVKMNQSKYTVSSNDGHVIESNEQGNNHGVLCIGISRKYAVIGYIKNSHKMAKCREEVINIVQHLINVGE